MQILPINYQIKYFNNKKQNKLNHTIPLQISFEGVDKRLPRFENYNAQKKRLTTELTGFLSTVENKLSITPSDSMKNAYAKLNLARTIEDVQRLFPDEERFLYLTTIKDTLSKRSLIGIYKNFEDILENGILKNGEDFTVYLLKKIFIDTKIYADIDKDLDNDLIPDIRDYFRQQFKHNKYINTKVINALGIYPPDQYMLNSLKFTKEGYADEFGIKISKALLTRLSKMTEEEKMEEILTRSKGLEKWWNSMSYEEKINLATSVDINEEGYKSYKKFDNEKRKMHREMLGNLPEFQKNEPGKKVKTGIKLNDKDKYVLWMQANIKKFYNSLTETEKTVFEIERSRKQAQIWKEKSAEEKTKILNDIRTADLEALKYAMIDAWNHAIILARVLSEFLKEKQVERPVHTVYATEEFSEFQSKIMTEFWEKNQDLAKDFGTRLAYAHTRIKDAIRNGNYEELKKEIEKEQKERISLLAKEYETEVKLTETKKTEIKPSKTTTEPAETDKTQEPDRKNTVTKPVDDKYKKDFYIEYKNRYKFLPSSYIREICEILTNMFSKDIIEQCTIALAGKRNLPEDIVRIMEEEGAKNNNPRVARLQRALEAAIAEELTKKGGIFDFYGMKVDTLVPILEKRLSTSGLPKQSRIDTAEIEKSYNNYKKDLNIEELVYIANNYFVTKSLRSSTLEEEKILRDYLEEYGRTLSIIFPSTFIFVPKSCRIAFNSKFLALMPQKLKDIVTPLIQTEDDIAEETRIAKVRGQIAKRFDFIPKDALDTYTRFVAATIRTFNESKDAEPEEKEKFSLENIQKMLCRQHLDENGEISVLRMPKYAIVNKESRLKLLAAEQAIANELFRVINVNAEVYNMELEDLAVTIEMLKDIIKKSKKLVPNFKKEGVQFPNKEGSILVAKNEPSPGNINRNYLDIMNEIYNNFGTIINEDDTINEEELLYILNPDEEKEALDDYILERIKKYTVLDKDHAQNNN